MQATEQLLGGVLCVRRSVKAMKRKRLIIRNTGGLLSTLNDSASPSR